jgi:hypothetical protein
MTSTRFEGAWWGNEDKWANAPPPLVDDDPNGEKDPQSKAMYGVLPSPPSDLVFRRRWKVFSDIVDGLDGGLYDEPFSLTVYGPHAGQILTVKSFDHDRSGYVVDMAMAHEPYMSKFQELCGAGCIRYAHCPTLALKRVWDFDVMTQTLAEVLGEVWDETFVAWRMV